MTAEIKLSLCIPTFNRWEFLEKNLPEYISNPYIDEIIISDENGADIEKIRSSFSDSKLKLFSNLSTLGAFLNKRQAVSHASNPWVCLIDSDNFAPLSYFEAWYKYIETNPAQSNIIYAPSFTNPQTNHPGFDYRHLMNDTFTLETTWGIFGKKHVETMLNTGNYIFNKEFYMKTDGADRFSGYIPKCLAVDVLFKNYLMLRSGARIQLVPNMSYNHIVHDGSYFMETHKTICVQDFNNLYRDKI